MSFICRNRRRIRSPPTQPVQRSSSAEEQGAKQAPANHFDQPDCRQHGAADCARQRHHRRAALPVFRLDRCECSGVDDLRRRLPGSDSRPSRTDARLSVPVTARHASARRKRGGQRDADVGQHRQSPGAVCRPESALGAHTNRLISNALQAYHDQRQHRTGGRESRTQLDRATLECPTPHDRGQHRQHRSDFGAGHRAAAEQCGGGQAAHENSGTSGPGYTRMRLVARDQWLARMAVRARLFGIGKFNLMGPIPAPGRRFARRDADSRTSHRIRRRSTPASRNLKQQQDPQPPSRRCSSANWK